MALVSSVLGLEEKAEAGLLNRKDIPPGIEHCRDKWVKESFLYWRQNENYYQYAGYEVSWSILDPNGNVGPGHVHPNTPFIEPAFHYVKTFNGSITEDSPEKIKGKNPSLYYFIKGFEQYKKSWIDGKYVPKDYEINDIENYFLSAIFESAGKLNLLPEYKKSNLNEQENILKNEIMGSYEKLAQTADKNKREINDEYNKLLVGAWSNFWLISNYQLEEGRKENSPKVMNFYNIIEQPMKKILEYPLREPPYYYLTSGTKI
ncbi:MAG: hypothetical protein JXK05_14655 [Campylobacterales bacterium]|nr:hypothetical protein [Campylobacterales bacterium]